MTKPELHKLIALIRELADRRMSERDMERAFARIDAALDRPG